MMRYMDAVKNVSSPPGSAGIARDSASSLLGQCAVQFPFEGLLSSCRCVLSERARASAKDAFISQVLFIRCDLAARVGNALEPQRMQEAADFAAKVERIKCGRSELVSTCDRIRPLLEKHRYGAPVFAMVGPGSPPRLTLSATPDCKCQVPWYKRSKWERWHPKCDSDRQVKYQLPHASSPWESVWDERLQQYVWLAGVGDTELADAMRQMTQTGSKQALDHHCCSVQARFACCSAEDLQSAMPSGVSSWRPGHGEQEAVDSSREKAAMCDVDLAVLTSDAEPSSAENGSETENESSEEEPKEEDLEQTPEVQEKSSESDATSEEPRDVDDPEAHWY